MHVSVRLLALCLVPTSLQAQWSAPILQTNLNTTASEFDPSPSFDGLSLYFSSSRTGNFEIFRATRATPYSLFGVPTQLTELTSTGTEAGPCVRIDDLEILFYSSRAGGGGGGLDIWRATRASTAVPFSPPTPVTELNTTGSDAAPSLTADGLRVYFTSTRAGGAGGQDIWTATRPDWVSPFGTPTPVTELNTAGVEREGHISADGLRIYFTSDRPGGSGSTDTWMASRLDLASPFGNIVNLAVLNSSFVDVAPGIATFDDEIFFLSGRTGGPGSNDIYSSRFTGLTGVGIATSGAGVSLRFSDPSSPGGLYLAISALSSLPGIPIDTRILPLNFDILFQVSIGGLPPVLTGYTGTLDSDGVANGRIDVTGFPQLVGLRFFTAFVVIDLAAPSGIRTISNAFEVLVQ
jgi:Tol biopolymer transport system component